MSGQQVPIDPTPLRNTSLPRNCSGCECLWCGRALPSHRSGSPGRFCRAGHRAAYWSACRRLGEQAVSLGIVSVADLKADAAACTLVQWSKSPPPAPDIGPGGSASPGELARFIIEVPRFLIHQLIFWHSELRYTERDDVREVLAALARLGRKPTITEIEHGKILAF
jgi:hypothetical protein